MGAASAIASSSVPVRTVGKYRLIARLGHGGMADVYLALVRGPMGFNKLAVVKQLRGPIAEDPNLVTMFFDEARLAARLQHPNVVHTYEVGEFEGIYFIAMEYLEGQPLNKLAKAARPVDAFTFDVWAWIVAEALKGLHYSHEACDFDGTPLKIVHRDVSPHNIFVTYGGQVKIVDFGIAKAALNAAHTEEGALKGKLAYMAPEQTRHGTLDCRADVFAIGIVLWELLAGQKLLAGDHAQVLNCLLHEPFPKVSSIRPDVPPELEAICEKALEKEPEKRFQTALEMHNALASYLRKAKEPLQGPEVGEAIARLFAEMRERVQRQIKVQMTASDGSSLPELQSFGPGGPSGSSGDGTSTKQSDSGLLNIDPQRQSGALSTSLSVDPDGPREARKRRMAIIAGALFGVISAAALVLLLLSKPKAPDARATTVPSTSATAEAAKIATVEITSDVPQAVVLWNGTPIGKTPLVREVPLGVQAFTVTADGVAPQTIVVELAKEHERVSRNVALHTPPPVIPPAPTAKDTGTHGPTLALPAAPKRASSHHDAPAAAPVDPGGAKSAEPPGAAPAPSSRVKIIADEPSKHKNVKVIAD